MSGIMSYEDRMSYQDSAESYDVHWIFILIWFCLIWTGIIGNNICH